MASDNTSESSPDTAIFASGCFWGTEHIFRKHFDKSRGLIDARVGYTGGNVENPGYRQVCSGSTGHAEAVKLTFDPRLLKYSELVEFFYRTHDASHLNHQGPDRGTQYRSAIFYLNEEQKRVAEDVTREVEEKHYKPNGKKVVTVIEKFQRWWNAEDYHQKYLHNNPGGYECPTHKLHW
ncbi:peptide methionine sulfoxide reductase MsrA [Phakopsora pachyrhizi]|nr:peptide methionine sulfoxide reductase MsrA [Phakopsora pachyrhizi]